MRRELRPTSAQEISKSLKALRERGLHVDQRLLREIDEPGELYLLRLPTQDDFLRLIWQSVQSTLSLAPPGQPRTLRACASRLDRFSWDFSSLTEQAPAWFRECVAIDRNFSYEAFGLLAIVEANAHELRETPDGTFYIFDGVHRSIVLAKRLLRGQTPYVPLDTLWLVPRRD